MGIWFLNSSLHRLVLDVDLVHEEYMFPIDGGILLPSVESKLLVDWDLVSRE
eukprot:CAMPEP_0194418272 /NCGR_PEP_ID=MMETSP0176-20130528/17374_1 /TAXON_ID=216777 /ORGANISM="Proboscia alata, Strain PI-D3" /LENGTH=51 /DNA_ID=CAMNT_0039224613 /DNA_START=319 /DNA_END=474 /DNA_ORIENTATION=+